MTKIIAAANVDASSFEIIFDGTPHGEIVPVLKSLLKAMGFNVKPQKNGSIVIWECEPPLGEIVTTQSVINAQRALKELGLSH